MPIIATSKFDPRAGHPRGSAWSVIDDRALARVVATVALGQWTSALAYLKGGDWPSADYPSAFEGARRLLTVRGKDPWHRDGWVFQVVSWAAAADENPGPLLPPQIRHAEKGFDGLQLRLTKNGKSLKSLVIFEDKATNSPRETIGSKVWPAFKKVEALEHDNELRSELMSLIPRAPELDQARIIDRAMRDTTRRVFRVAITVDSSYATADGIKALFAGYETKVSGHKRRRRAHILELDELREWMAQIAAMALEELNEMERALEVDESV